MRDLLGAVAEGRVLVSDGAWGTFLQQRGLKPGECPELWNAMRRQDVSAIAQSYVEAGADMILTNSFGGNPIALSHHGLEGRTAELNRAAAAISRQAAGEDVFVLGSMGPTGAVLMLGEVGEEEVLEGFRVQAGALAEGGADAILIETMSALDEASLAIRAARAAAGLPVICTFTFMRTAQDEYRSVMGAGIADMVAMAKAEGASIIGTNCGNGFTQMIDIVREMRGVDAAIPILVHANAGLPLRVEDRIVYPETPEFMASLVGDLAAAGANIIGGCCGTGPEHIRAIARALRA